MFEGTTDVDNGRNHLVEKYLALQEPKKLIWYLSNSTICRFVGGERWMSPFWPQFKRQM